MYIKIKNKRGQSTVEYVLLVTAVVAVMIAFVASPKGVFQNQLENATLNTAVGDMGSLASTLSTSHQGTGAATVGSGVPTGVNVIVNAL